MDSDTAQLIRSNLEHAKLFQDKFAHVQDSQEPDYVTICCSDSRVLQDHMWGNDHPGEIFTCGNIGNRVFQNTKSGKVVSGDVLYPVAHTETQTVIVVGHTGCGAVTATYKHVKEGLDEPEGIMHCIDLLNPSIEDGIERLPDDIEDSEAVNRLVEYNVDNQVKFLRESDDIPENVTIIGAVYDFQDVYSGSRGQLHVINVDGVNDVSKLKNDHTEISDRVERLT